jgi:F-box/WD-40 domain protein 10
MAYCYEGMETIQVEMEERNLFCGAYNVFVLQDSEDPNRCTTYNGESLAAVGSSDRRVRLVNASTGRCEKVIKGHSGSIRSLLINEKRGFVLSGSYDTSIRYGLSKPQSGQCGKSKFASKILITIMSKFVCMSNVRDHHHHVIVIIIT